MHKAGMDDKSIMGLGIYDARMVNKQGHSMIEGSFCHLILSRSKNKYSELIKQSLKNCFVIHDSDFEDEIIKKKGFFNMTKSVKSPCSWEKAFYFIENNKSLFERFDQITFMEDDVFSSRSSAIEELSWDMSSIKSDIVTHCVEDKSESEKWVWWACADKDYFEKPIKSFNPLCRLSKRMVDSILDFRKKIGMFVFHEILFCSLAYSLGYTTIPIESLPFYEKHFGKFLYRPIISTTRANDGRIYHPVKPHYW